MIVRADGRPTYNFASPVEDWLDGITHVLRGEDHVSNTPKQIQILERSERTFPSTATSPNILGPDGKKLSKRHGATSVEEFREQGYIPEALVNFLALLGWSYDDKTTVMSRDELVERFTLERVGASPAVFDFQKLDWLNGVYLRELSLDAYADRLVGFLREQGYDWDAELVRKAAPLVQEKIATLAEFPDVRRLPLPRRGAGPGAARRRRARACRADAGRARAVHGRDDRAGAPRARRASWS